ncbi:MAG: fibronectin type III domain-containing protein [Hormoscilla sp. GM102CHS1]|nr:fibronectin type III domain-containing protein [Hormoscilla sp. GM102CHS1]
MAKFPRTELEVIALANGLIAGLTANSTVYPSPPLTIEELTANLNKVIASQNATIAATAAAKEATIAKNEALEMLTDNLKRVLRYAENTVNYSDEKLELLGWGGRSRPSSQGAPGQVRSLKIVSQRPAWIALDWKAPTEGGPVKAYKVQRRITAEENEPVDVGTALESKIALVNQPRGKELIYQAIAINKAGEGTPSNIVTVTL